MAVQTGKPAKEEDDPWQTSAGFADNFVGYISEPFFGVDEKYNPEAMLFCATLQDKDGEPLATLKYSVGRGWVSDDDGAAITHPARAKINEGSRFGYFVDRLAQPKTARAPKRRDVISPNGKENGLGLGALLKGRGTPLEAKSFNGLGFLWQLHKMPTLATDDKGEIIYKDGLLPTEYVGTWEERTGAKSSPTQTTSSRPAAPSAEGVTTIEIDIPAPLRKKLTAMAKSSKAQEFLRAAARDNDVISLPDEVMNHVLSGGDAGFWASVQEPA